MILNKDRLREIVLEVIKACDLDCSQWHPDAQRELAAEITENVWKEANEQTEEKGD
jgi:hypothetical protein